MSRQEKSRYCGNYSVHYELGWTSPNIIGGSVPIALATGECATIAGGRFNVVNDTGGAIGGGSFNRIGTNGLNAVVAGGFNNVATAWNATIPGGANLTAQSYGQFVAGVNNVPQGTSTQLLVNGDDYLAMFGNGFIGPPSNAWTLSNNGHSIVTHNLPTGDSTFYGATYTNNTIIACGDYNAPAIGSSGIGGGLLSGIGDTVKPVPGVPGSYQVILKVNDPNGSPHHFTNNGAAIVVTGKEGALGPGFVTASDLNVSGGVASFTVNTYYIGSGTTAKDYGIGFQFHVVAQ